MFWVFRSDGIGKRPVLLTAGREWDGKAGSHLVDGTGREPRIFWWDGMGRNHGTGQEQVEISVEYVVGNAVGNIIGKAVGKVVDNRSGT